MYIGRRKLDAVRVFLDTYLSELVLAKKDGDSDRYSVIHDYLHGAISALDSVGIIVHLYPVYASDTVYTYSLEVR